MTSGQPESSVAPPGFISNRPSVPASALPSAEPKSSPALAEYFSRPERRKRLLALGVVAVLVVVLVLVLGGGSAAEGKFLSACNIAETKAADYGGPAVSCTCILNKAKAQPGSTIGAGGYSDSYIEEQANKLATEERNGQVEVAVVTLAVTFGTQLNSC